MLTGREGSFWLTVLLSFFYGIASFVFVINHSSLGIFYEHDFLSLWVLSPLGAFCGFVGGASIHELAHFFTAHLVGSHVHKIRVGTGKLLIAFRLMGTNCEIYESLRSGMVISSIASAKRARIKMALVTGAGPLASVILVGGSIALLSYIWPLIQPSSIWYYPFPVLVGWTLPCILFLPGVLLPYQYQYAGRKMETDALRLLKLPWLSDADIEKRIITDETILALQDQIDFGTKSLDQALERANAAPNNQLAVSTAAIFLRQADDPRALIYYKRLIDLFPHSPTRTQFIDQYLTYSLEITVVPKDSEEMDQLSREIIETNPGDISIMGTRGSILIDLGRIEEGKAMLLEVLQKTESSVDKSYANIFLALAESQQGNLGLARDYAEKAAQFDPNCPALKRISELLPL